MAPRPPNCRMQFTWEPMAGCPTLLTKYKMERPSGRPGATPGRGRVQNFYCMELDPHAMKIVRRPLVAVSASRTMKNTWAVAAGNAAIILAASPSYGQALPAYDVQEYCQEVSKFSGGSNMIYNGALIWSRTPTTSCC
jgi:hypothetical protein